MLHAIQEMTHTIILCDDLEVMKDFYCDLLPVEELEGAETSVKLRLGSATFFLRKRTRDYDGHGIRKGLPGFQLAFLVEPDEVASCHDQLVARGVPIAEPPTDQPRGHRTVYFFDPEGNLLEVYALI